jgi:hypothetical protein
MRRALTSIGLAGVIATSAIAVSAMPAMAASQSRAVSDCNAHGRLTQTYTPQQLQTALSTMPADIKEYTNCYDVIQRALVAKLGGHHASGSADSSSSGSFLPTPVIVVLVLLALAAATFGGLALSRRSGGGGGDGPDEGP